MGEKEKPSVLHPADQIAGMLYDLPGVKQVEILEGVRQRLASRHRRIEKELREKLDDVLDSIDAVDPVTQAEHA